MPVNSNTCPTRPRRLKQVGRILANNNGDLSHVPAVPPVLVPIRVHAREGINSVNQNHLEISIFSGTSGTMGQETKIIKENPSHLKKRSGTSGTDSRKWAV
jgi:hypothetical protein